MKPTGTEQRVCEDIAARQQKGITKYGTTVTDNPLPLRDWLQHAYEETLDQAIYLKRAIEELSAETGQLDGKKLVFAPDDRDPTPNGYPGPFQQL